MKAIAIIGARVTGKLKTGHLTLSGPPMRCETYGKSGKRTVAACVTAKGERFSCAMIRIGAALPWQRYWKQYGLAPCR